MLPFNATQVTCPHNGNNPQWGDACHTLAATDRPTHIFVASKHDPTYAISGNIIGREPENGGHHLGIEDDGAMFTLTTADRHAVAFSWNAANSFTTGDDVSPTLKASHSSKPAVCMASGQANAEHMEECCPTQSARQYKDPPIVALSNGDDMCGTLCARDYKGVESQYVSEGKVIAVEQESGYIVRRLMPVECERLQGFPDGWTDIEFKGRPMSDTQRYKMLGNSMAVPVVRWIGSRIDEAEKALARAEKFAMKVCGAPDKHHTCLSCKWSRSVSGTDCRPLPLMGCVLEDCEICLVEPGDSCDEWEEREE